MRIKKANLKNIKTILRFQWLLHKYESNFDKSLKLDKETRSKFKSNTIKALKDKDVGYFIAYEGKKPIGFAEAYTEKNIGIIGGIYILTSFRKRKIGLVMFKTIMKWFKSKKVKKTKIEVYNNNKSAINFWKNLGYKKVKQKSKTVVMSLL